MTLDGSCNKIEQLVELVGQKFYPDNATIILETGESINEVEFKKSVILYKQKPNS